MKNSLVVLAAITISVLATYYFALFNFFAQDDFILINHFSQNNLLFDLRNVFLSKVTHWRPVHNLYFLIAGNLFGKNFFGYHLITFTIHAGASFLIYKVTAKIISAKTALIAALFYALHPAHFISLTWISGAATTIGFFFLTASFYSYLQNRNSSALILYTLALLSSEAMLVGIGVFFVWGILKDNSDHWRRFFLKLFAISVIFAFVKLLFLTTKTTFVSYQIEVSAATISAVRYYLLRILGFAEVSGDQIPTLILGIWIMAVAMLLVRKLVKNEGPRTFVFLATVVAAGLFPFILIPSHLSPHYMNISIWAIAMIIAWAFSYLRPQAAIALLLIFVAVAVVNIQIIRNNNWVVSRSNLAKFLINEVGSSDYPPNSTIVFGDSQISTSEETYIALGTGEALSFWLKDKNYKPCFTAFEKCD